MTRPFKLQRTVFMKCTSTGIKGRPQQKTDHQCASWTVNEISVMPHSADFPIWGVALLFIIF